MSLTIKPAVPGSKVHLEGEAKKFLPQKYTEVPRTPYWVRRINDGSVVEKNAAAETAKAPVKGEKQQ